MRPALKVLIVEDEFALRTLLSEVLASEGGFDIIEVGSGDEAIEYLRSDPAVDCIFSDVKMPGKHDGLALARYVQSELPNIKMILASGHLHPADRPDRMLFFSKPYDFMAVADAIRNSASAG